MKKKVINLRSALSRFEKQKVRVIGVISCISSKRNKKGKNGRHILLKKVKINNSIELDHMWMPYKSEWHKFNNTAHTNIAVTFLGTVKRFKKDMGYKYIITGAHRVETYADFKNPNIPSLNPRLQEKEPKEYSTPMDNMDVFMEHFENTNETEKDVKITFTLTDHPSNKVSNTKVENLTIDGVVAKIGLVRIRKSIVDMAKENDTNLFEADAILKLESRWVPWGKIIVKHVRNITAISATKE